ncbi:DNA methyltransferase [Nevskia sp.]|uniref:class I SAM-dependent DNA methyltransferase n=1 Tax=Nevskia sp. TaxID=1929292 RepID=UPI0025DD9BC5|nr:DNA methyltransferase [Nevskia sp.]
MNAVEIEQAITDLADRPFESAEFPYGFLEAFGNKETTIKRLRAGASNKSDLGGVLQTNNIHILTCDAGRVTQTLAALKASPATAKAKAKFILATDGADFEAEDLSSGETVACAFKDFPDHFGFFLPLAGINTVRQISENAFDIRATSRLNRLYVELLKDNPEWGMSERRHDMNKFMARLIFCFFAEDTDIFSDAFTDTVATMSAKDASNTHEVIATLFRAMNIEREDRATAGIPRWATDFPYVNGQLFSGSEEVPRFSRIARSYLVHVGGLDWTLINPDIFGSMIQAVTEDEERGELGMHYTSVPNILKVLNPLFLDDLREKLEEAGDNVRMLLNLRKRIAKIRVFDPACGSGNFLVIAYKEMRAIEAEINRRRGEPDIRSLIPLTNFRGIELRDFPAEIARLALVIAEYQCDVLYRGKKLALAVFLPLRNENWITCGNALRLDWLAICPPTGRSVKVLADDLFGTPLDQAEIDFENEGGETYICGNPPYKGSNWRTKEQTQELSDLFSHRTTTWKALDYVCGWVIKASDYSRYVAAASAFVMTNSVCQGLQASILWPLIFETGQEIAFAHTSFKWSNLASHNAGVSVVVVGLATKIIGERKLYETNSEGQLHSRQVTNINAYLLNAKNVFVEGAKKTLGFDAEITDGSGALDGGFLILDRHARDQIIQMQSGRFAKYVLPYMGSGEFIKGTLRWCLWIEDRHLDDALQCEEIARRVAAVKAYRIAGGTRAKTAVSRPHKFAWINKRNTPQIIVPTVFSEKREYVTAGYLDNTVVVNNAANIVQNPQLYVFSVVSSSLHICWVEAVSGKLEDRIRYTSATCYNTFPLPELTEKNKADLTRCAEEIILSRERHFPATIAELYDPDAMPADLRMAHDRNDEVLERIYIGRRFKNDTERLEKLFDLYTKMTASAAPAKGKKRKAGANA